MRSRLLIAAVVLLCVIAATTGRSQPHIPSQWPTPRPPRPFCYCRPGFTWRRLPRWPYCQCYKFVRDLASWAEAKVYCGVMRAHMMEVRTSATLFWLTGQLNARESTFRHHLLEKPEYWLGATDLTSEGQWRWDPSNTVVPGFWMPGGQPDNYLGYQNCLAIKRRPWVGITYRFFDDDCYQKKFYICERRGWYCWGQQCWRRYSRLPKTLIPSRVAKVMKAAAPPATAKPTSHSPDEKVKFEDA
ncbi:hypothetical protein NP493_560g01121 [Ridgeia piscesae]|uniref:C-type lectin domain-containing protein n=1 Tax=Ridgeia piscesae TaxID=27915 RepID=A0AAD9NRK8_RIDPI|nr:hypothetical protein NP493_560g01121 [Ridgeia piscesae]